MCIVSVTEVVYLPEDLKMASAVGLELLYASIENQIRSQYDALVCCLHWNMIQNGFKCVGVGEEVSMFHCHIKFTRKLTGEMPENIIA